MAYHYFFEDDQYVLKDSETGEILDTMAEVALLIDSSCNTLITHGRPNNVLEYERMLRKKAVENVELRIITDHLMKVSGRIPVDILNKCLDIADFAGRFFTGQISNIDF